MDKPKKLTISIDAAVARMINLDFIPSGVTLLEVTLALQDFALEEFDSARGNATKENLKVLINRATVCKARHMFALCLHDALEQEVNNPENSMIETVYQSTTGPLLNVESVLFWAALNFNIMIPEWKTVPASAKKITGWEECKIMIYRDFKIGLHKEGRYSKHLFQDFDLMGRRKHLPNKIGRLLIWLSLKKPTSTFLGGITRKDISLLREALRQLTGLTGDPFFPLIEKDNYIPRFRIIDDRRNADKRARDLAEKYGKVSLEDEAYRLAHGEAQDYYNENERYNEDEGEEKKKLRKLADDLLKKADDDNR